MPTPLLVELLSGVRIVPLWPILFLSVNVIYRLVLVGQLILMLNGVLPAVLLADDNWLLLMAGRTTGFGVILKVEQLVLITLDGAVISACVLSMLPL